MLGDLYPLFEFEWEVGWGGGGRFLNFFALKMGACSRWALIRGSTLIRINTDDFIRPHSPDRLPKQPSILAACDVSPGETYAPQRHKFQPDDVNQCFNSRGSKSKFVRSFVPPGRVL